MAKTDDDLQKLLDLSTDLQEVQESLGLSDDPAGTLMNDLNSQHGGAFGFGGMMTSLALSIIGFGYLRYGHKGRKGLLVILGLALLGLPYVIEDIRLVWFLAVILMAIPFIPRVLRRG